MSKIRIKSPGMLSTIQDRGRIGYQQYGVPVSGAADIYSLQLANVLVGNSRYEGCLEMTMNGATIEFLSKSAIAITGADMSPTLNGQPIQLYKTVFAEACDILEMNVALSGFRSYLAIAGGFAVDEIMDSKSTYLKGGFGGFKGRKLEKDDQIITNPSDFNQIRMIPREMIPSYSDSGVISVIMGTEEDYFLEESIERFLNSQFKITDLSDRMGIRLDGPALTHKGSADILSSGISEGTIQVPKNGKPIIMMSDRQTTGGYTRIANVISTDIPKLAQMKPGNTVVFQKITLPEAHNRIRSQEEKLHALRNMIQNPIRTFRVSVNGVLYEVEIEETL